MKKGFTLAEVLITLGIIGVVAALTLPSLIQNQQKHSLEVATKKFYSTLSQAVRKYMADEGVDDLRNTSLASDHYEDNHSDVARASIDNFVNNYLKVVQKCSEQDKCFADIYKTWDGQDSRDEMTWYNEWAYVLADGSVVSIGYSYIPSPINIYVDVNGKKGPNRVGYDLWGMSIFHDGTVDESNSYNKYYKNSDSTHLDHEAREHRYEQCKTGTYSGCFGHFLENGFKFDY